MKLSKQDLVTTEASAWFVEFRTGEATAADRARFYEWLRASPDHIQAYLEIAEGWAELPTSDPHHRIDLQALIQQARASHDDNVVPLSSTSTTPRPIARPRLPTLAQAASLAAITLALGLVWIFGFAGTSYRTGIGEQRIVRLPDGSTLELNARSSVRVRYSRERREVDLERGQAFFQVAKDASRPFWVVSGATSVRAVGTQFDVYRKSRGTVVTVVEGRVAVSEESASPTGLLLGAGEQIIVPADPQQPKEPPRAKPTDVGIATAWVHQRLIFEETPLSDVAEEFNRYNTRRLVIEDPALRALGISGVYSSTDPDSLLGFLRAQPTIQLNESDREIIVTFRAEK
jgi:transmembrane sensor